MKAFCTKIIFSIFFLFNTLQVNAQMVYIPDSMFRQKLSILGFSSCIVGDSIDSSCPLVNSTIDLNVSHAYINDLQGIQAFINLENLYCDNNNFISIPALPSNLKKFQSYECNGISIASLPHSLEILVLVNCQFSSLPPLPNGLRSFFCVENNLTSFPWVLPDSLIALNCMQNSIHSLPPLPVGLTSLNCSYNLIDSLPTLPDSLDNLTVDNNQIVSIPTLPSKLSYFSCNNNHLTSLPILPNSIVQLNCSGNTISTLPTLPTNLFIFDCSSNMISTLPSLPNTIKKLFIGRNLISDISALPTGLVEFKCENNQLQSLPAFPVNLGYLNCSSNPLTSLPDFPNSLVSIQCNNCSLTSIPTLPDLVHIFDCSNNSELHCLPYYIEVVNMLFSGCPITCKPTQGYVSYSAPDLDSILLCDLFNHDSCEFYWNIEGKAYHDIDNNCVRTVDPLLPRVKVMLINNGVVVQQAFTDATGEFSFDVNSHGIYGVTLDTTFLGVFYSCPTGGVYYDTISITDSIFMGNDFGIVCDSGIFDLAVASVSTSLRAGRNSSVSVLAGDFPSTFGLNCAVGINATLVISITGNTQYVGPAPGAMTPSSTSGNVLVYNIPDVGLISPGDFDFLVLPDSNALIGSKVCFNAVITPITGDVNPINNTLNLCFEIRNSYDPNDKQVYPTGEIDTTQDWMIYTIRFQNTGNAEAENVYVLDTLNNNFDISTFQLMATSHPSYVQILEGGIARFNFPNINLVDSFTNEPLSHGFIQYKIKLKDNLPIGTDIRNKAYIYFDFNPPVITNTTSSLIQLVGLPKLMNEISLSVWPMPFSKSFMMQTESNVVGSYYSITDILGNRILFDKISSSSFEINSEDWTSGIYFLRVDTEKGSIVKKLLKD